MGWSSFLEVISPFWCPRKNGPTKMTQTEDATQGWHKEVAKGTVKKEGLGRSLHPGSPGSAVVDPYPKYCKAKGRTEGTEEARCGQALATGCSYCFWEGGDVPIVLWGGRRGCWLL